VGAHEVRVPGGAHGDRRRDLLCQVVARDTAELEELVQTLIAGDGVVRTRSQIALTQRIPRRSLPLVRAARWRPAPRR
jgi:hypothetical protein